MKTFNWVFFGFLLHLCSAVILDDAFIRDWTKNWVGHLSEREFQSSDSIIGLTHLSQLFNTKIDTETNSTASELIWRADLSHFGANPKFLFNKKSSKVYTYSAESTKVYAFDSRSGVLDTIYELKSEPLALVNFFNRGVLLINRAGSIELLPEDLSVQPQLEVGSTKFNLPNDGELVKSSTHNGLIYIAIPNNKVILEIAGDGSSQIVEIGGIDTNKILDMKENLIVTQLKEIKQIVGGKVKSIKAPKAFTNVVLINSDYFANFDVSVVGFSLYKVDEATATASLVEGTPEVHAQVLSIEYLTASINDFLVVSTPMKKVVVDISGLLSDDDPSSAEITMFDHLSSPTGKISDFLEYDSKDKLQLITSFELPGSDVVITRHREGCYVTSSVLKTTESFESQNGNYLIVNKPALDQKTLDNVNHLLDEETDGAKGGEYKLFVVRWWSRFHRHVIELIEYAVFALTKGRLPDNSIAGNEEEQFGLKKLIVFVDTSNKLVAVNSLDGSVQWLRPLDTSAGDQLIDTLQLSEDKILVVFNSKVFSINLRNGSVIASYGLSSGSIAKVFTVEDAGQRLVLATSDDSSTDVSILGVEGVQPAADVDDVYLIDRESANGYKLSFKTLKLIPTWKLPVGANERIVIVDTKSSSVVSSGNGLGIVLADKSVLYKYLYPNVAAVVTFDEELGTVTFSLVDVVTGALLHEQSHVGEAIDLDSILLTMDGNWVIYTYFSTNPSAEQRIVVVDLFETGVPNEKSNLEKDSSIFSSYNQTIGEVSTKSFIFPERILQLSHSVTKFGITTTSILAFTESGSLVQIPKFALNSRRIADREFTQADAMSDFRLTPYEPVITGGGDKFYHVLNHKNQLSVHEAGKILSIETELESTSVVCYFNDLDWFCTTIQPSLQYDTLGKNFAKSKLIITMLLLLLGVLITKPMVDSKRLNAAWLDRS